MIIKLFRSFCRTGVKYILKAASTMTNSIRLQCKNIYHKWIAVWPIITFFLSLFFLVLFLFGFTQVMLVSVMTVIFKLNYKKPITRLALLKLAITTYSMALLAYLATWNVVLCISLNMLVPFILVHHKVSQLTPLAYFGSAMCFTFLQLRPVNGNGFIMQLLTLTFGLIILGIAWGLASHYRISQSDDQLEQKGLHILADSFASLAHHEELPKNLYELFDIHQKLYQDAFQGRQSRTGKEKYLYALLFQQAFYFLCDDHDTKTLALDEKECLLALDIASFLNEFNIRETDSAFFMKAEAHMVSEDKKCGIFALFSQQTLRVLWLLTDDQIATKPKKISLRYYLNNHLRHMRLDAFETRFALRLSLVLTVSFFYNMVFPSNHSYWFALNAFLLLRPMYEDSAKRLKTRFIGTSVGCMVIPILIHIFPGVSKHVLLASLLAVGLYMETPGTWTQAFFSTSFALTLATISIPGKTAIWLRLLYVVAAVLFVLIINRFFFPVHAKRQFKMNFNGLFQLQNEYLQLLKQSLDNGVDYEDIYQIQVEYQMIYNQILKYIDQLENDAFYTLSIDLLTILWKMSSIIEQLLLLLIEQHDHMSDQTRIEQFVLDMEQQVESAKTWLGSYFENDPLPSWLPSHEQVFQPSAHISELMSRYQQQVLSLYQAAVVYDRDMVRRTLKKDKEGHERH